MSKRSGHARRTADDALSDPALAPFGVLVPALNDLGLALTAALVDVGFGSISSNADIVVLATIRLDGPQRPSRLADVTGLTSGGTTNLLDRLEGARLVRRTTEGVDDGRGVLVEITPDGTTAIERIGDVVATELAASPERFDQARDCLRTVGREIPVMPSSLTDPELQLGDLLRLADLGRVLIDVFDSVMHDPTPSKSVLTLWFASQPGGVRPGRLAELTGLSSAGVSELLDRLEQRDLIMRTAGRPPDRRVVIVESTPAGRELLATTLRALGEHLDEVEAPLSSA